MEGRILLYGFMLAAFYVLVFAISSRMGLLDVALPTTLLTLMSYGYFLGTVSKDAGVTRFRDIAAAAAMYWLLHLGVLFVYTATARIVITPIELLVHASPAFMWTALWSDHYARSRQSGL